MSSVIFQIHNVEFDVFRQLPDGLFAAMKDIINGADNVTIAPSFVVKGVSMLMFIYFFLYWVFTAPETWSDREWNHEDGDGGSGAIRKVVRDVVISLPQGRVEIFDVQYYSRITRLLIDTSYWQHWIQRVGGTTTTPMVINFEFEPSTIYIYYWTSCHPFCGMGK